MAKEQGVFRQLMGDKFSRAAFCVLVILYVCVFSANFISPYPKDSSDRQLSYAPPSKIYVINEKGKLCKPYTYNYVRSFDKNTYKKQQSDQEKAINIAKEDWGEDSKVEFTFDHIDKDGRFVIFVRDIETTRQIDEYVIDVQTGKIIR